MRFIFSNSFADRSSPQIYENNLIQTADNLKHRLKCHLWLHGHI